MGNIQAGQIRQVQAVQPTQRSGIQTGRVISGITSADEKLRSDYFKKQADAKKAYDEALAKQQAEIDKQNADIEASNALLKAAYDKAVSDIKDMSVSDYKNYYYQIPDTIRNLFQNPEQLSKQIADEKVQRATEQLNSINDRINKENQKVQYYTELYNKTSDQSQADSYDRQRYEHQMYAEAFNELLPYATGDYDTNSLFMEANYIADQRSQQNFASVDASRLNSINEAKLIEQYKKEGMTPVYKYPKTQLQELIGFTPIGTKPDTSSFYNPIISSQIKSTPINKNVIKLGTSQQQILQGDKPIYDKLGNLKGIESIYLGKSFSNINDYNNEIQKLYNNQNNQMNPIESAVYNYANRSVQPKTTVFELRKAPTFGEMFKTDIKKEGYIKGTLTFAGERLAGSYDWLQQRGYTDSYQQEPIRNLFKLSPNIVYFTPAAPFVMLAGGTETLIRGKTVQEKLIGGVEAGLGFIGVKGELSSLKSLFKVSKFEKAPTLIKGFRYETEGGGLDVLYGKKVVGKDTYETLIKQPFRYIGDEGKIIAESGKGITTKYTSGLPKQISIFETGGRSIPIEATPRLTTISEGFKITRPIEAESSASRLFTKTKFKGELNQVGTKYFATGEKIKNAKPIYETYIGFGKEEENLFKFVSGKAEKARVNILTGEKTIIGKPNTLGIIKRINPQQEKEGFEIFSAFVKPKTVQKLETTTTGLVEKGISQFKPTVVKTSNSLKLIGLEEFARPSYVSGGEVGQVQQSGYYGKGSFEDFIPSTTSISMTKSIQVEQPKVRSFLTLATPESFKDLTSNLPILKSPQKESEKFILKQPSPLKLKTPQSTRQPEAFKIKSPQALKQPEVFKQPSATKQPEIFREPTKTRFPKPIIDFLESKQQKRISKSDFNKAFSVLLRSRGKVIEIGKNLPYYKALKLGVSKSKSSLAQTFALRESGTTRESDISYRVPANLFTQPKRKSTYITPLTFTERRGKTLSERTEVKQIGIASKSKSRNKLKWF